MTEAQSWSETTATRWITAFGDAIENEDTAALRALFVEDSHWRDLLGVTWDSRQISGRDGLVERLLATVPATRPRDFRLSTGHVPPSLQTRTGRQVVEAFFEFDTSFGSALGLVRIMEPLSESEAPLAWMLLTRIDAVDGTLSVWGGPRPTGVGYDKQGGKVHWAMARAQKLEFADRDPEVLIVGGGHAGVMLAAHLNRLGVDNLVIDAHARIGDNWRTRYESLQLHNQTQTVQFPYLPFPDVFPEYIPKDKLANWFEGYVEALEINFWTSTPFTGAKRDADDRWTVELRRDGQPRTLRPRFIVMTTGGTGTVPFIPDLPGMDAFTGSMVHSKEFHSGADYAGKDVQIVGVGTSAHDIAQSLTLHDAKSVTMLQRGSVTVTSLASANSVFGQYSLGLPIADVDAISALGWAEPVQRLNLQLATKVNDANDADLLSGLQAAGLRLDDGDDHTGWVRKFISKGGGYYINVGGSELILEGRVKVLQAEDLDTFTPNGLRLRDGSERSLDAVILATGFKNQDEATRAQFGDEIADRLGRIGGYDHEAEVRNTWRPTAQPGLYFGSGSIQFCRTYTPLFAMMLKAELSGLAPAHEARELQSATQQD